MPTLYQLDPGEFAALSRFSPLQAQFLRAVSRYNYLLFLICVILADHLQSIGLDIVTAPFRIPTLSYSTNYPLEVPL